MKTIRVYVSTNKVGSQCETSFQVEDNLSDEEIEEFAKEAMFDLIEWNYTIDGQHPN